MSIEVKLPQLGESVHEGTIGKWLKAEGEEVKEYEPLLEVVTDKVDTEVTAPGTGTLLKVLVPEGETIAVGTVLAVIGTPGEDVSTSATPAVGARRRRADRNRGTGGAAPSGASVATWSPVAARVAADHGVDVTQVVGTGRGGAITKDDVESFVRRAKTAAAPAARRGTDRVHLAARGAAVGGARRQPGPGEGHRQGRSDHGARRGGICEGRGRADSAVARLRQRRPRRSAASGGVHRRDRPPPVLLGELVKLTPIRKSIAEHMVRSKHTAPHVGTIHEVDMGAVMAAYRAMKAPYAERGVRLTLHGVHRAGRGRGPGRAPDGQQLVDRRGHPDPP